MRIKMSISLLDIPICMRCYMYISTGNPLMRVSFPLCITITGKRTKIAKSDNDVYEGSCVPSPGTNSSCARQNVVNATRRSAGNSSFCQAHAFQSGHLHCTSTHRQFIICLIYSSKFYSKPDFVFKDYILKFYLQC